MSPVAKRKTLFDDRPVEISELTYIIKRDIASLNGQIAKLQPLASASGSGSSASTAMRGKQAEEHCQNVLVMLQGKLATTSMQFKDILEIRTQNMKATKSRTEQFGYTNAGAANAPSGPSSGQCPFPRSMPAYISVNAPDVCSPSFTLLHTIRLCPLPVSRTAGR